MDERVARRLLIPAVDLAGEPDFELGRTRVHPSLCTIEFPDRTERLEPRVMQVLIALARAKGVVVTKDHLIDRCWSGRIVGEDAINRTLAKLRQVAQSSEPPAFEIETVPKVGYRLVAPTKPAERPSRPRFPSPKVIVAAGALVLAAVGAWAAVRLSAPHRWVVDSYTLLAADERPELWPAVSPDGRVVAYVILNPDDQMDIWMRSTAGGDPVPLVTGPESELAPAWSPDGRRIAFVRWHKSRPGEPCSIVVKAAPAGVEQVVGRCHFAAGLLRLSWTPSADALIFSEAMSSETPKMVRRLDLKTRRITDLTHPPARTMADEQAVVSPDGRSLAFVRYSTDQSADAFVQDLRTGRLTRATHDQTPAWLDWSPDGKTLFVTSGRSGPVELWAVDPHGRRAPERLVLGLQDIVRPSAGDGIVAFQTNSRAMEAARLSKGGRTVVASGGAYESPDLSTRGDLAMFSFDGRGHIELQRRGAPMRRLLDLDQELVYPHGLTWSPDGRRLAFGAVRGGKAFVFTVDVEAGLVTEVPTGQVDAVAPAWAADGKALYLIGADQQGAGVWRAALGGGPPQLLARSRTFTDIRVDGAIIYVAHRDEEGVWRIVPGGQPVLVGRVPHTGIGQGDWRVVHGLLYAIANGGGRDAALQVWPLDGRPALSSRPMSGAEGLAIDPNTGEQVLLRVLHARDDIGMVRVRRS